MSTPSGMKKGKLSSCTTVNNPAYVLSPEVRSHLSPEAQRTFMERYNSVFDETEDPMKAEQSAWEMIHQQYEEDENGFWSKQKVTV